MVLIYLWCSYLLGGGRTPSVHVLSLANCCLDCFLGEVAHIRRFVCKGFFYKEIRSKGARLDWDRATSEEGAPCLGAFIFLDLYSSLRGDAIVSGSFVYYTCCILYFLHHLYRLTFQIGFPRGVLSRVVLTKNTCALISCMLEFRSTL